MFSKLRLVTGGAAILAIIAFIWYVSGLKSDLQQSQENVAQLRESISEQSQIISSMERDQESIIEARDRMRELINTQQAEIRSLNSRFTESADGSERDLGELALAKPGLIENIINESSSSVVRCVEIASGSELTEEERNEGGNSECSFDSPSQ